MKERWVTAEKSHRSVKNQEFLTVLGDVFTGFPKAGCLREDRVSEHRNWWRPQVEECQTGCINCKTATRFAIRLFRVTCWRNVLKNLSYFNLFSRRVARDNISLEHVTKLREFEHDEDLLETGAAP